MDYEEKYKNVLKWARQVMNGERWFILEELKEVFSELAESEDERIRKELIKVFSNKEKYLSDQSFGDITVSEALTWLEKQGEQKTTWSEEDETSIAINNPEAYRIGFADDKAHAEEEMAIAWLEKQGQVKENQILQHEDTHEDISCKENDNSLTREQKPQRFISAEAKEALYGEPTAWSERDERFLNQTIEEVDYALNDKDMFYSGDSPIVDWLKSIKQKLGGKI